MNEPRTEAGRAATKAIKSGILSMWADDPDDPIAAMVASVERAAGADALADFRTKVGELRIGYPSEEIEYGYDAALDRVFALLLDPG